MHADHSGHFSNGIQAHSAGPLFPFMVRGVGNGHQAFDGGTGRAGPIHHGQGSYAMAEADCQTWLDGGFLPNEMPATIPVKFSLAYEMADAVSPGEYLRRELKAA